MKKKQQPKTRVNPPAKTKTTNTEKPVSEPTQRKTVKFTFDETTGWWYYVDDMFLWVIYKAPRLWMVEGLSMIAKVPIKYRKEELYYTHEATGLTVLKPGTAWNCTWRSSKENLAHHPIIIKSTFDLGVLK